MRDGRILGIDDEFFHDQGAYVRTHGATRAGPHRRHAARALSRAGLSRGRPFPADQQDAGRDLSRARTLREHLRARAADGCDRGAARARPRRGAPAQSHRRSRRCPSRSRLRRARRRHAVYDSGDYAGLLDKALARFGWTALQRAAAARAARAARRSAPASPSSSRRAGSARPTMRGSRVDGERRGRARHRRRLGRPGLRDRDGADLRRRAGRRLSARARHPRPDRPHRSRHRRACLARHGDDRSATCMSPRQAAREGLGGRGRAAAGAAGG